LEKTITQLDGCFRKIEIKVPLADMERYYEDGYKKARKEAQMPGFRRGKVPMHMIKKLYGAVVEMEAQQDAINEIFPKITEEDKIAVLGQPSLTNIDKNDDEVVFTIEYETLPEIQLKDYKSMIIDEPVHSVEDEEIEKSINNIKNENADFEPAQIIENENFVASITMTELNKETKESLADVEVQEFDLYLNDDKTIPELKEILIKKNIKDEFEFEPPLAEGQKESKLFKVVVNDIQKLIPKELTADLIKEITNNRFDNEDDLREEIGFQLQEQWDNRSREKMEMQIIQKIVEMHDNVSAPDSIVENVMKNMFDDFIKQYKNLPKDTFDFDKMKEVFRPRAEETVKFELIRNRIIEEEGIKVEDYDIESDIETYANQYKMEKEQIKEMLLKNENYLNTILHKKVIDFILGFVETREVDFEGKPLDDDSDEEVDIAENTAENDDNDENISESDDNKE
jgi:trigger factor